MNIVLVNYGQADNNSAQHVFGFARGLAARGHDVVVALAKYAPRADFVTSGGFRTVSHRSLLKDGPGFSNGAPADVLHVWTPRENVRQFAESYEKNWGVKARVIHLEDNEEAIFRCFTGRPVDEAAGMDIEWPRSLIHPTQFRRFLESACGLTLVHRCLEPLAVATRVQEIVPVIDFDFFSPRDGGDALRHELGIAPSTKVIAYNGNDHAASVGDIRLLYDTLDRLVERGRDVALVRTGHVLPPHYDGLSFRPGPRCHELGFIDRAQVPRVIQIADVVIQPGNADAFNSFRLPSKIPEYLSMGKALITGRANIGPELEDARCALVLPQMTSQTVADAVDRLLEQPAESAAMGLRAGDFARTRFAASVVIPRLEAFYQECREASR